MTKFVRFFSNLPLFAKASSDGTLDLELAVMESSVFLPLLRRIKLDIFPRDGMAKDKYFEYIPITWTACNMLSSSPVPAQLLLDMMVISMLNYQADEYMEAVIGTQFESNTEVIRRLIEKICHPPKHIPTDCETMSEQECQKNGKKKTIDLSENGHSSTVESDETFKLRQVEQVLSLYVSHIMSHRKVQQSSRQIQGRLLYEVETFLKAHVIQIEDNAELNRLRLKNNHTSSSPNSISSPTFFDWVRTTGANHTSCPYSFALYCCYISKPGNPCFVTVRQDYLAQDLCRHLATLCRMYNDYGSLARDHVECNFNSLDFEEFGKTGGWTDQQKKADLMWLAEYEREGLDGAMRRLGDEDIDGEIMNALMLLVNVTDLYGQIYVARDIASRMK